MLYLLRLSSHLALPAGVPLCPPTMEYTMALTLPREPLRTIPLDSTRIYMYTYLEFSQPV
jgi:hypothetical protein